MKPLNRKTKRPYSLLMAFLAISLLGLAICESMAADVTPTIKIGVAGPMKYEWGKNMWAGAQVAAEEINAGTGILVKGRRYNIELINADSNDYHSVVDAVNTFKKLITVDKVDFLVAGARSEAALAQQEVMAENKKIYLFSSGGDPKLHDPIKRNYEKYKYYFDMAPNSTYHTKTNCAIVDMVADKMRRDIGIAVPKIALVIEKAIWADAVNDSTKNTLPKMGLEIVGVWRPSPFASDLTSEITAIKTAGAHIIYEVFTGPAGVILNKQVGELQAPVVVIGNNPQGVAMGKRYWNETNQMCEYEMLMAVEYSSLEITEKTIPVFNKISKKVNPIPVSFGCYDAIYALKEAIEKAGTLESDAVVVELEKINIVGTEGKIAFYPRGHMFPHEVVFGPGYHTMPMFQWQAGRIVPIYPSGHKPHPAIEMGPGWEGFTYKGVMDFKLPPRMIRYWKK